MTFFILLAILACSLGGALGGFVLARPDTAALRIAAGPWGEEAGQVQARIIGAMLLVSHGATAAFLGYAPSLGAAMALTLSFLWFGAAAGLSLSMARGQAKAQADLWMALAAIGLAVLMLAPFLRLGQAAARNITYL
jgi:hypothetical protein